MGGLGGGGGWSRVKGQATRWPQGIMVSALLAGTHIGQDYEVNKEGRVGGRGSSAHKHTSDPERNTVI